MKVSLPALVHDRASSVYFALFGFAISSAAFYPGFMSFDSLAQYATSRSLIFDDWHPPLMSWVWSILNVFFKGPAGLLFFHLSLLWLGLLTWAHHSRRSKYSWLILSVGFLPWVINFSGVLWKDVGMAFSLLLCAGIAVSKRTPTTVLFALALLFYAINLRHNAIFAAVPIVALMLGKWFEGASKTRIVAMTFIVLAGIVVLGSVFNYEVLKSARKKPSNYVMIDDLSYLSLVDKRSLIPNISYEDIQLCANQLVGGTRLVGRDFCLSKTESYIRSDPFKIDLRSIWAAQVIQHPFEYVKFRLSAFAYLLRPAAPHYIWQPGIDENRMGIRQERNGATILVEWFVSKSAETAPFLFKPYWWLWLSSMLLLLTLLVDKHPATSARQALLISSILYVLGYFPATTMADFRYVYWSVLATSVAAILIALDWRSFIQREFTKLNVALAMTGFAITAALFSIG